MKYKFFAHEECEYYPCHDFDRINCKFCFCPVYQYSDCGGDFTITDAGIKDCSQCRLPHSEKGHDYIVKFLEKH